jgi:hypothetical protein
MRHPESQKIAAAADVPRELLKSMAAGSMTSATIKSGLEQIITMLEGK